MMRLEAADRKWLSGLAGDGLCCGEPMSRHTSFRVGGPAEAFVQPAAMSDLSALVSGLTDRGIPYHILGGGTNLLVRDGGIPGVVISLRRCCRGITVNSTDNRRTVVTAMSGERLQKICAFAIRRGLEGLVFALGIPGTVGGAIRGNAGTPLGWISGVLESVEIMQPSGRQETIPRAELSAGYRCLVFPAICRGPENVIISGRFALRAGNIDAIRSDAMAMIKQRRRRQPITLPNAGCIFKNPSVEKTAGELIDLAGMKGFRVGDAMVSEKHANFIVNTGSASAADILAVMARIQQSVYEKFQVSLETEVMVVGE